MEERAGSNRTEAGICVVYTKHQVQLPIVNDQVDILLNTPALMLVTAGEIHDSAKVCL